MVGLAELIWFIPNTYNGVFSSYWYSYQMWHVSQLEHNNIHSSQKNDWQLSFDADNK